MAMNNPMMQMEPAIDVAGPVQPNDIVMRASEIGQTIPGVGALAYKQARKGANQGVRGIHRIPETTDQGMDFMKIAKQNLNNQAVNMANTVEAMAPPGHMLAYITPDEAGILKLLGGSGEMTAAGVPAFANYGRGPGMGNAPGQSGTSSGEGQGDPGAGGDPGVGVGDPFGAGGLGPGISSQGTDVSGAEGGFGENQGAQGGFLGMGEEGLGVDRDDMGYLSSNPNSSKHNAYADRWSWKNFKFKSQLNQKKDALKSKYGPILGGVLGMFAGLGDDQVAGPQGYGITSPGLGGYNDQGAWGTERSQRPDRGQGRGENRPVVRQTVEDIVEDADGETDEYLDEDEYYLPADYWSENWRVNEGDLVPGRRRFGLRKSGKKIEEGENLPLEEAIAFAMQGGYSLLEPFSEFQSRRKKYYGDPDFGQGDDIDYSTTTGGNIGGTP